MSAATFIIAVRVQVDASSLTDAERIADELVPYLEPATASAYALPSGITAAYVDDVRPITE